jgi:mRNA-degrading endonuclease toxin of MazEF toxin-antitoxin module
MKPGEIYSADLPVGQRSIIIVSREDLNQGNHVVAVLCTTAHFAIRSTLPNCVPFRAGEFGFTQDCVAQCQAITFVDKQDIDSGNGPTGVPDDARKRDVIRAIGHVLDADCEPII